MVNLLANAVKNRHYATHEEIFDGAADLDFAPKKGNLKIIKKDVQAYLANRNAKIFVATCGDEVIGFNVGVVVNRDSSGMTLGYNHDDVVKEGWRGMGVWRMLSDARDKFYTKNRVKYEYFFTNPANGRMLKIGRHDGYRMASVAMVKELQKK